MTLTALALALAAAALHAAWNVAVGGREDPEAASAALALIAPVLFLVPALATWRVDADAVPFIAASAVLHFLYFAGLAAAYARADVSVVYPVARGLGPVVVLVIGASALGAGASPGQVAGVVLVASGVLLVRGIRGHVGGADLGLALFVAACIGGYTLVDNEGVEHAAPLPYLWLTLTGVAIMYVPLAVRLRGAAAVRAEMRPQAVVNAGCAFGAYALVLAALALAPAAAVAAVRESSVVIAALLARFKLRETVGLARLAGAVAVAGGVAAIALS